MTTVKATEIVFPVGISNQDKNLFPTNICYSVDLLVGDMESFGASPAKQLEIRRERHSVLTISKTALSVNYMTGFFCALIERSRKSISVEQSIRYTRKDTDHYVAGFPIAEINLLCVNRSQNRDNAGRVIIRACVSPDFKDRFVCVFEQLLPMWKIDANSPPSYEDSGAYSQEIQLSCDDETPHSLMRQMIRAIDLILRREVTIP